MLTGYARFENEVHEKSQGPLQLSPTQQLAYPLQQVASVQHQPLPQQYAVQQQPTPYVYQTPASGQVCVARCVCVCVCVWGGGVVIVFNRGHFR